MKTRLRFTKLCLNRPQEFWNSALRLNETKVKLFCLNANKFSSIQFTEYNYIIVKEGSFRDFFYVRGKGYITMHYILLQNFNHFTSVGADYSLLPCNKSSCFLPLQSPEAPPPLYICSAPAHYHIISLLLIISLGSLEMNCTLPGKQTAATEGMCKSRLLTY